MNRMNESIYTEKYGLIQREITPINTQSYGNCTLHNYNFAIKHCFRLDSLKFSMFKQMIMLGLMFYVKRWLSACIQQPDGALTERNKGVP